jgi:DNA-binding SARP family transcriptional activator
VSGERLRFQLLGPVQARCGDRQLGLGVRKQRFVLAVLALEVNRMVTVDRLAGLLWPDDPPASARGVVRGHVSGLRATFTRTAPAHHGVAVRREGPGYLLVCDPADIDAHRFDQLAGAAAGETDDQRRVVLLDEALALWHGPALAGTAPEQTRAVLVGHLEEARLTAIEDRFDAMLRLDRTHGLVEQLTRLSAEQPHRHRLVGLLMRALHGAGRTAEALHAYQALRRHLADHLGLDPPADMQRLEVAILRDNASPASPAAPPPPPPPALAPAAPALPRAAQLPAELPTFAGRRQEVAALLKLLPDTTGAPTSAVVIISGTAGVGKTTTG